MSGTSSFSRAFAAGLSSALLAFSRARYSSVELSAPTEAADDFCLWHRLASSSISPLASADCISASDARDVCKYLCVNLAMLRSNLVKRKVDPYVIEADETALHSGKTFSLQVRFKQGIDQPMAKKIIKLTKDAKMKVQTAIQCDKIRVTGKKRDDLQAVMALIRGADLGQPFQFDNFRD